MANLSGGFNADEHKSSQLIPEGEYDVVIIESDLENRKSGPGQSWKFTFQIMNGLYQNRQAMFWLMYEVPGATEKQKTAIKIGKETIANICRAVNVLNPKNTQELQGKRLKMKLKIKEGTDGVERNQIGKCVAMLSPAKPTPPAEKNLVEQAFEQEKSEATKTTTRVNPYA